MHQHGLRDLERESLGCQPGVRQRITDVRNDVGVLDLPEREIDGHAVALVRK
jgi:hypothetical protein